MLNRKANMSVLSHSGRVACGELAKRGDGRKASFSRIKTYFEPTKAYFAAKITKESLAEKYFTKRGDKRIFCKSGGIPHHFSAMWSRPTPFLGNGIPDYRWHHTFPGDITHFWCNQHFVFVFVFVFVASLTRWHHTLLGATNILSACLALFAARGFKPGFPGCRKPECA